MLLTVRCRKDPPSTMVTFPGVRARSDSAGSWWSSTWAGGSWGPPASWQTAAQGSRAAMPAAGGHDARGVALEEIDIGGSWKGTARKNAAMRIPPVRVASGDRWRAARTQAARVRAGARGGDG